MPYIGRELASGAYRLLDSINATESATYNLTYEGTAFYPETPRNLIVSVNGVTQAPVLAYTVSGSTITFAEELVSTDEIDYILALGDVYDIGVPSDDTVDSTKLKTDAVTTNKIADGAVTNAKIDTMAASKLTGALPAIDGSALTGIESLPASIYSSANASANTIIIENDSDVTFSANLNVQHIVPQANVTYDLGTSTMRFRDIYLSGNTINLGDATITADGSDITIGSVTIGTNLSGDGSSLTSLNASQLSSGTVPDARFPTTLPSANGTNLTSLNATEITTGTIANARLPSDIIVANDLTVQGDFVVNGNTTTIAASELKVEDSLIQLASNNEVSDTVDIGFVGHYYNGSSQLHTGFFRDADNGQYYLFTGYDDASFDTNTPPATIDRTSNTFTLADLTIGNLQVGLNNTGNNYITIGRGGVFNGGIQWSRGGTIDSKIYVDEAENLIISCDEANLGSENIIFQNGNATERMRIESDGDVRLGYYTSSGSASSLLDLTFINTNDTEHNAINFQSDNASGRCYINYARGAFSGLGDLIFGTSNAERMRITSDGIVAVQGSSQRRVLIESTSGNGNNVYLGLKSPDTEWQIKTNRGDQFTGASQGDLFIREETSGINALLIQADTGKVGIGIANPTSHLHVKTSTSGNSNGASTIALERPSTSYENAIQYITNGVKQWFVGQDNDTTESIIWYNWVAAATRMTLTTGGNLTIGGTFTESSALRYKENVQDLEYNNIISQLKPKIYNKIGQEEQEVGLIAEDVEALDKTLVTYQEDGTVEGIKYTRLVPHLIAHIQKLEERIARMENGESSGS